MDAFPIAAQGRLGVDDEGMGGLHQHHITGQSTVGPPIGTLGGYRVFTQPVIDVDHQVIGTGPQVFGDINGKGDVAPYLSPQRHTVQEDGGGVIRAAEPEVIATAGLDSRIDAALIPDAVPVEEQVIELGVEIAGDSHFAGSRVAVLQQLPLIGRGTCCRPATK